MDYDALRQPFIKSNRLLNLDEAWTEMGKSADGGDLQKLYKKVSYLFRGVDILCNAVARMPFTIYQGDQVFETSQDYQNKLGWLKNPGYEFGKLEAALQMWGNAYQFRKWRGMNLEELRYILPSTIRVDVDENTGETVFIRTVNGKQYRFTDEEIVYYWDLDPFVEKGEAQASPVEAAASAAGVLFNVDEFAAAFFQRGAIKATLLSTKGNVAEAERSKLRTWWRNLTGSKESWNAHVVNADAINATVIGEGIESLDNRNLTDEQREAIATALGIPHSILFSNAANFAVSDKDDFHFYDKKVVPDCLFIQSVMNDQVLGPLGYRLKYEWQTLDVFQEDEKERSAAVQFYAQSFSNYGRFTMPAMMLLGVEIPPDAEMMLEKLWSEQEAQKEQQRQDFIIRMEQSRLAQPNPKEPAELKPSPKEVEKTPAEIDLEKWKRYALKRVKAGKIPDRKFTSEFIEGAQRGAIWAALQECQSIEEVNAVFDDRWTGYP